MPFILPLTQIRWGMFTLLFNILKVCILVLPNTVYINGFRLVQLQQQAISQPPPQLQKNLNLSLTCCWLRASQGSGLCTLPSGTQIDWWAFPWTCCSSWQEEKNSSGSVWWLRMRLLRYVVCLSYFLDHGKLHSQVWCQLEKPGATESNNKKHLSSGFMFLYIHKLCLSSR